MPRKGQTMSPEQRAKISATARGRRKWDAEKLAESAEKRFLKSVKPGVVPKVRPDLGPCLLFTGAKSNGYGQFRYGERNGYAHRYAWERANGTIPDGLTVDHLCRVRHCVEASHMELVDAVTNYMRAVKVREKCPNGHSYANGNLRIMPGGFRRCLTCYQAQQDRQKRRRSRSLNGLPNRRIKYDQDQVRDQIAEIRRGETTIAQAARAIGCNPNYLGRRVWQETKRDVLARDLGRCVICSDPADDAHHRTPRGSGGTYDPLISFGMANLISLCRFCHDHVESRREEALDHGWLIKHGLERPHQVPVAHSQHGLVLLDDDGDWTPVLHINDKNGDA